MLALAGQPSLLGYDAFMVYWVQGAGKSMYGKTSVSPFGFFCLAGILEFGFGV